MLRGIIQGGTNALGGSRFSLVSLLPTAFFVTFMITLIASGAYTRPKPSLTTTLDKLGKDPGLAIAVTLGIFLLAVLLRPFQVAIVQLLEGYWRRWRPLEFANDVATERHRRIRDTAEIMSGSRQPGQPSCVTFDDAAYYARQRHAFHRMLLRASATVDRYPFTNPDDSGDDRLMPTLLGNILRDGEDNAGRRYGLDMPVVYPRMYPSLSPKLDKAISTQLDMLDTTAALCVAFGLSALFSLPLIARLDWWSLVPVAAMLMSLFAYRGAIATAQGHSELLATAFDLHRFDMLQALHYKLPLTPDDELELNRQLSGFLGTHGADAQLYMRKFRYNHPATVADSIGRLGKPDRIGRKRLF
jgi:hypothetical protein